MYFKSMRACVCEARVDVDLFAFLIFCCGAPPVTVTGIGMHYATHICVGFLECERSH